jgi:hypothetical protein
MGDRIFASGKNSNGQCDRCGWDYAYNELSEEPGTRLKVCPECNDRGYSRVCHPQNFPPKDPGDAIALRNPRPDPDAGASGIFLYGQTSNGFATEYTGTFILSPQSDTYPVINSSFFEYNLKGINASCVTGSCLLDVLVQGASVYANIPVSASTGNTDLSGIMSTGDNLSLRLKGLSGDCQSVKVEIAILRVT